MSAHRYYRLFMHTNNGGAYLALSGFELSTTNGGVNVATSAYGSGSGSSIGQGIYPPSNAFDENPGTYWVGDTVADEWLAWDFGAGNAQNILEFRIVQSVYGGIGTSSTVGTASFQHSDDGISWTTRVYIVNPSAAGTNVFVGLPATATIEISAPPPTIFASSPGYGYIAPPSPTVSSYGGGNASITAPSPRLNFTAHGSYGDNAAFVKPPKITVSAYGGGRAALTAPSPNLTSTATGTALAVASLTAPSPTVEALGTVSNVANISITIPGPNVLAYAGSVCSVTIAGVTVQATGTGGGVAHAAITIPLFQLDAQGTAQNHGGANISAPMPVISTGGVARLTIPMATLTAIGTATVTATYEAYALNLKHTAEINDEVTHYTNFPFTHIVRYKDRYYGANSTGLYLLEGTTDDGAAIEWAFKTGMTDFDSPQLKTVTYAYFGGRMGPDATVTIYPSEPTGQSYAYTTPRGQTAQNYRQQFGKGLKARYYAIGASGSDALELDSIDLTVATLTRRI